ncbi:MAG: efflux RND transporter periplasmic adaptor subunit [Alphaproteobacteria bacterium GM7ARS4]|nr:efflux RND transporter periplasmic adaptor subunit [Alphaproteobacteria bacterium GM7ARS4]
MTKKRQTTTGQAHAKKTAPKASPKKRNVTDHLHGALTHLQSHVQDAVAQGKKYAPIVKQHGHAVHKTLMEKRHIWQSPRFIALSLFVLASTWIMSGRLFSQEDTPSVLNGTEIRPSVVIKASQAQPHAQHIILRGQTEPSRIVPLRTLGEGHVIDVLFDKGRIVKKDDIIIQLDPEDLPEQKKEAEAFLEEARIEYDASANLTVKGYRSQLNTAGARKKFYAATASLSRITYAIQHMSLRAPFDGILIERHAELGSYLKKGDQAGTIVDLDPLLLTAEVSEDDILRLQEQGDVTATLANGTTLKGALRYTSQAANEQTRTFRIEAEVDNPQHTIPAGLSAEMYIALDAVMAHNVKHSALTINDEGVIGVKAIDDTETIVFYPVTLIADTQEGLWLSGLPDTLHIVTRGQDFVNDGQHVQAFFEDDRPFVASSHHEPHADNVDSQPLTPEHSVQ